MKQLSQAEYQSQEEVDKANKLFKKLRSQEKKLVGVYSSEYEKIDDILTDKKSLAKSIDFLERILYNKITVKVLHHLLYNKNERYLI